ncbi:rhodanese-like domain-containing protein [Flavihumibacter sp. R14]|nr:rhodanese-like domain-containing protein [Flavihumibacter soli]
MEMTVNELKRRLDLQEPVQIIDVREQLEFHTFNIGGENIPLGNLLAEVDDLEFDKNLELVVVCQRGIRSETARRVLSGNGFTNVMNLSGGLLAWRKLFYKSINE